MLHKTQRIKRTLKAKEAETKSEKKTKFLTFTAHATLPKGGAALPNLRIPILPSKTIVFPTPKTPFRLLSKLEAGLYLLVPPLFCGRGLGKRGPSLQARHGQEHQNHYYCHHYQQEQLYK